MIIEHLPDDIQQAHTVETVVTTTDDVTMILRDINGKAIATCTPNDWREVIRGVIMAVVYVEEK